MYHESNKGHLYKIIKYLKLMGKKNDPSEFFILCTSDAMKSRGPGSQGIVHGISGKTIIIKICRYYLCFTLS